ncbi:MAG: VOC family protein [Paracoccaceae bacterium]
MLVLDHLAVSGDTVEEATALCEEALGVSLLPGGQHPHFGTHNRLLGLADGLYLEAIAIDPNAPKPDYPRWFNLDQRTGPARLTNWICRTEDMGVALGSLPTSAGVPVPLSRGDLAWEMAVPQDGLLPFDNLHPALIQWHCDTHPADMLPASGCRLLRLTVSHPDAITLKTALAPHLTDDRVAFEIDSTPALTAEFDTPGGRRTLT